MRPILLCTLVMLTSACVVVPFPVEDRSGKAAGGGTLVCHKGKKTLDLPQPAVQAHLDHGDRLGPC
jgi:hypothetical protein